MLFDHLEEHPMCLGTCLALYRLLLLSKEARAEFKALEGINFLISRL